MTKTFVDLEAWQVSIKLDKNIYLLTRGFPREEIFGITSQIRRAVVSISSNLAEGSTKDSTKDFIRFIGISLGSLNELKSQIILAHELNYLNKQELDKIQLQIKRTGELIGGLKRYLCNQLK